MKASTLLLMAGTLTVSALACELVITSFQRDGRLTWSHWLTGDVYQVQWANAPTGPWQLYTTVTNQTSVVTRSLLATAQPPIFLRVIDTGLPPELSYGVYQYLAYDDQGTLVVTGRFCMVGAYGDWGAATLACAVSSNCSLQAGTWPLFNHFPRLGIDVTPGTADGLKFLLESRTIDANGATGVWSQCGIGGCDPAGPFTLTRVR